jgi:acyl-CoA thioesterase FadM
VTRVKIDMPGSFPFSTEIDVRITDINYGRHLGNDALLSLVHEARVRFLGAHGLSEANVGGKQLVMTDAVVLYRAEAFAGDRLRFDVALGHPGRAGCDVYYRAVRISDGRLVAEVKTGVVFLDHVTRKIAALPDAIRALAAG